jgi:CRP/FNR family cyclic AMP-dependent transcriptional regulator
MKSKELQQRLAGIELFSGLSKKALAQAVSSGRTTTHTDGHEVIVEGAGASGFHLILSGKARVTSGGSVRRTLGVGDYFGEISVIDGKPRSSSIEADGPLETFMIPPSAMRGLLDDEPKFARQIMLLLCSQLREAESRG